MMSLMRAWSCSGLSTLASALVRAVGASAASTPEAANRLSSPIPSSTDRFAALSAGARAESAAALPSTEPPNFCWLATSWSRAAEPCS